MTVQTQTGLFWNNGEITVHVIIRFCSGRALSPDQLPFVSPETHTKRQATQHDGGGKVIEIMYVEDKVFCTGPTRTAKTGQKSLVPAQQIQRTNEGRTLFIGTL